MLKDDLYQILNLEHADNIVTSGLSLNLTHPIFTGHYPGQPVLPGACMLEIVKEVLSAALEKPVSLHKATQVKFLKMIDPREHAVLSLVIKLTKDETGLKAIATLSAGSFPVLKFQGIFKD